MGHRRPDGGIVCVRRRLLKCARSCRSQLAAQAQHEGQSLARVSTTSVVAARLRAPVGVVIVLHNSSDGLEDCLLALPAGVEIVVVDNASTDSGPDIVANARPEATLIRLPENVGFGAA